MKVLPMYINTPGMPDLVHHTTKHYFGERERTAWDRVPAGGLSATGAWKSVQRESAPAPPRGRLPDTRWWAAPWLEHVRHAHDQGFRPRYQLLIDFAGDPAGPRWETAEDRRRIADRLGFHLVLEPRGEDFQVLTAYFRSIFGDQAHLRQIGPPLRAFAARNHCPPGSRTGVPAGEPT